jgi:myosin III
VAVISGESGAGKTESAKLFIKQIIALSAQGVGAAGKGLEDKIVALNPLLEAYGNAQTLRNDNSSRFGKFIELRFNDQHVIEVRLFLTSIRCLFDLIELRT